VLLLLLACTPSAPPRPANVLLLSLDTVRADALGTYGGRTPTPHLDRLANEGVAFDAAYTVTPLTVPAHASLLTGLWPPRHGVRDNGELVLAESADTLAERLAAHGYGTMAAVGAEVTSRHWGFSQGFGEFFDEMAPRGSGADRWRAERRADAVTRDALAWLRREEPKGKPWFAWVHLYDAHDPYRPPEPFATTYAADPYAGEVAWVDSQVGALLDGLAAMDALDHTWIIAVSDHGESLGEHGEATHGVLLYEGATRVPFLVRPPGGVAQKRVAAPVSLVDVTPTVLGALGVPFTGLDGVDLSPVVRGGSADADREVYAESLYAWRHFGWAPQYALYTPTHALLDSTTPEVYTRADRAQSNNLASDLGLLSGLRARLAALRARMTPLLTAERSADPNQRAALEALGYLSDESAAGRDATGAPLPGLPDPVQRLPVLARVSEAQVAYRAGDVPGARRLAEAAVAADPGLVETRILLATIRWRTGDVPGAWEVISALDAEAPSAQTRHLMGLLKLQMGETGDGARLLGDAVARDPYNARATETLLQTLLVLEDFPALAAAAARARENLPKSAIVAGMSGVSKALAGDAAGARPLLEEAIAANPAQPFVHHGLGLALRDLGDLPGARSAFEEEIRRFPPARPSRAALDALPLLTAPPASPAPPPATPG
jgi:arylsulfatase A-like enzyme/thioredoxin-like negative regulator of GroEL